MIDITGYLVVHFTVMMMTFFFLCFFCFLTIKQSNPNVTPPWHVTEKNLKSEEMLPNIRVGGNDKEDGL